LGQNVKRKYILIRFSSLHRGVILGMRCAGRSGTRKKSEESKGFRKKENAAPKRGKCFFQRAQSSGVHEADVWGTALVLYQGEGSKKKKPLKSERGTKGIRRTSSTLENGGKCGNNLEGAPGVFVDLKLECALGIRKKIPVAFLETR